MAGFGELTQPQFWISALEIIWINILLSGDNAIVIALACRSLPPNQRLSGMVIGTAVALAMRLLFASIVSSLMLFPFVKIVGGLALLWIAVKLLTPNEEQGEAARPADSLWRAVKLIALADVVMSLDNVIAVAGAANGNYALLAFGLGISVPTIVAGATLIMAVLTYVPLLLWGGAALLGWIAGDMTASDPVVADAIDSLGEEHQEKLRLGASLLGSVATVLCGYLLRARQARQSVASSN
jgi:YjbE family integral membrane protein